MSDRDQNTRDSDRLELLGGLSGEVMVFQPMVIREISGGGMQIETGFALQLDSLHDFRLTLPSGRSVVVKGRVAHSHICDVDQDLIRYSTGIEFVQPADRVAAVIDEFIGIQRRVRRADSVTDPRLDSSD
jgi:hypothetical protein